MTKVLDHSKRIGEEFTNTKGQVARIVGVSDKKYSAKLYICMFIATNYEFETIYSSLKKGYFKDWSLPSVFEVGISSPTLGRENPNAYRVWVHMLERCYDVNYAQYKSYGGQGVTVHSEWLTFATFVEDIKNLPNYAKWLKDPFSYSFDKDVLSKKLKRPTKLYSKQTCMFIDRKRQIRTQNKVVPILVTYPSGRKVIYSTLTNCSKALNVSVTALYGKLNNRQSRVLKNFKLKFLRRKTNERSQIV